MVALLSTRLMGLFEVGFEIIRRVPDAIAHDAMETDLPRDPQVSELPRIQSQEISGLFLADGHFSIEQLLDLILFRQHNFEDFFDQGL